MRSYGVAISSTSIALLLNILFQTTDAFFCLAIIISTLDGGSGPGIVAVILSTLAITFFFCLPNINSGYPNPKIYYT